MAGEHPVTQMGELASSISDTHKFGKEQLIFLNTSDILHGKFLHHAYSAVKNWPGQAKKSIRKDDILFSEIRPANGRWAYVQHEAEDYVVSTKLMVIRAKHDRVFPKFLYQFLTSVETTKWLQHLAESRSGTFPQITFEEVSTLELPLPPLPEQKAIAAVIGALDDKIELNRRINVTLEAMARALFQSWIVDFDPVRAKLEGRQPTGMDSETAALFPSHFCESELGPIPKGWAVSSFSDAFKAPLRNGLTRPKSVRGIGTRMVNMGELFSNRRIGNIEMDRVLLHNEERERNLLETGDLLFARQSLTLAGAGQCSIVIEANEPRTFESHLIRCRLDGQKSNPWFFFYYFLSPQGRARVVAIVEQVAAAGIRGSDLTRMKVLMPPIQLQHRFSEVVTAFENAIAANNDESRTLAILRDTLLPKLLGGTLRLELPNNCGENLA